MGNLQTKTGTGTAVTFGYDESCRQIWKHVNNGAQDKYDFGARYYDPFLGLWMSPDPAGVFFRVTFAWLKPRSYIEKDILRLSDGRTALPEYSSGASRHILYNTK